MNNICFEPDFSVCNYVQRVATPSWEIAESVISFTDLTFIYKGKAVYTLDGKDYHLCAGDVICIPSGVRRKARTFAEATMHSFALNLSLPENTSLPFPLLFHPGLDEELVSLYHSFDRAWLEQRGDNQQRIRAYLTLIMCRLEEMLASTATSDKRIEQAKEYILNNFTRKLDIKAIADLSGLNSVYFGALFKKSTGVNVNEYINRIRINKAKDLLADGFNISETAFACGFDNVFYFSNVFKKFIGISPSEFRKK